MSTEFYSGHNSILEVQTTSKPGSAWNIAVGMNWISNWKQLCGKSITVVCKSPIASNDLPKREIFLVKICFRNTTIHDSIGHFCLTYVPSISFPVWTKRKKKQKQKTKPDEQIN